MNDAVQAVVRFNAGRDPRRLAIKYEKMASSAFAFLRCAWRSSLREVARTAAGRADADHSQFVRAHKSGQFWTGRVSLRDGAS
jgi:hypothetical protein